MAETHKWRRLSDRLFDIREGLDVAELTLDSWQRKYDIQARRPILYMQVLFGKQGTERLQITLGSINMTARAIKADINKVIGQALKVRSVKIPPEEMHSTVNEELVKDCLRRIRQNMSWSHKFHYSVLGKMDDLEGRLNRLHMKLTSLERLSDLYLEKEHPDIFSEVKRLPGRRVILKVGDSRMSSVQGKLLDALAARKDAELLHRASGQGNKVHIGLSVPHIHKRDFAFLLNLHGRTHEVLVHPVKIKAINDASRVQNDFPTAVPALIKNTDLACYMLPSSSTTEGFQVSIPPVNLLSDLEYKDTLSTIIRDQHAFLGSQILYSSDQSAIASGIAQGCFRLIGSQWLQFLDCGNIRWRRTKEGKWISMLTATPGNASITRTLEQCLKTNGQRRDMRDLSKHLHIFRIGLVIAELALKSPISYIDYDGVANTTKLFVNDGEEIDANDVAAEVERKSNVFLGNMAFFCLNVLQDRDAMADKSIEGSYFKEVLRNAEQLDALVKADRRRGGTSPSGSGVNTPRRGRGERGSGSVY
ncbi:hypothetical protein N0V83_008517 [Neocucurbitaria cava]|uniref:Uncharacterized protein n=1 Tax=Neocucurbitaria cava TaxID=798079 RepID=A0A9W8Y2H4_9PLEO|nr:hypothetical protein N0V83_008517 [Neocucurbitaria cava]